MGLAGMAFAAVGKLFKAGIDDTISDLRRKNRKQAKEIERLNKVIEGLHKAAEKADELNQELLGNVLDDFTGAQDDLAAARAEIADLKADDIVDGIDVAEIWAGWDDDGPS
jgi:hypothetical protein